MSDDYTDWVSGREQPPDVAWTPYDDAIDWDVYELGEWAGEWAAANASYLDYLDDRDREVHTCCLRARERGRHWCSLHDPNVDAFLETWAAVS